MIISAKVVPEDSLSPSDCIKQRAADVHNFQQQRRGHFNVKVMAVFGN